MKKHIISLLVLFLMVSTSMVGVSNQERDDTSQRESFDSYLPHSYLARYNPTEYSWNDSEIVLYHTQTATPSITGAQYENGMLTLDGGLMNSSWPMYCHDTHHTGRSPYSTVNATGVVKWGISTDGPAYGGPTIDSNGTIYIGSYDLNAIYPNGTLKWKYTAGIILCAPAIAEDGTIYFGVALDRRSLCDESKWNRKMDVSNWRGFRFFTCYRRRWNHLCRKW